MADTPAVRCPHAGDDHGAVAAGTTATQPAGYRLADIDGQWKPLVASAFAADDELAGMPVDVTEFQRGDLTGA